MPRSLPRRLILPAVLSAVSLPLAAQPGGAVAGVVYDSLAGAPLAGARVLLAGTGRAATTDDAGAFRIADVAAGEYGIVFEHPRMERIGWMPDTLRTRVAPGGDTPVELAIPSLVRLGVLACRGEAEPGTSVAVGRVTDAASGQPVAGARVAFSWAGMAPRLESAATTARVRTEAVADEEGMWYACDLPQGVEVVARVDMPGYARRDERFRFERPSVIHTQFLLERGGRGQTAFLTGRVLNQQDGAPLQGAIVGVEGTGLSAMSDELGYWELGDVPPGDRMLRVRHGGAERMLPVEVAEAGVADLEIRLPRDAYTLAPITVTATRNLGMLHGFYERRQTGGGQYITRSEIQRRAAVNVLDLLQGARRGRELCGPIVYVDDVLVYDPYGLMASRSGLVAKDAVAFLNVTDVEGIEYYSTGLSAPPQYIKGDGRCAVLAVWTRRGTVPPAGS